MNSKLHLQNPSIARANRSARRRFRLAALAMIAVVTAAGAQDRDGVIAAIFDRGGELQHDWNRDGVVSAADLVVASISPPGSPTATPTPTPTPTAVATETPTPTPTATATATATATPGVPTPTATSDPVLYAGTLDELFPHALGDHWIFRMSDTASATTMETARVVAIDGDTFDIELQRGNVHEVQRHRIADNRLSFVSTLDLARAQRTRTTCTPPLVRLALPARAGEQTSTSSTCNIRLVEGGGNLGSFALTETTMPMEIIASLTVPAGTYTGVIHLRGTRSLNQEVNDIYLAPGIGLIKRVVNSNTGTRVSELFDGSVGGVSVRR